MGSQAASTLSIMAQRNTVLTSTRVHEYYASLDSYSAERENLFRLFQEPLFLPREGISEAEQRDLCLQQVLELAKRGFLRLDDVVNNPGRYLAITELIGSCNGSTGIKAGVQFTLWGGSIALLVWHFHCSDK